MTYELVLNIQVILNNTIVNTHNGPIVADVRMCVIFAGFTVGCPPGVADAAAALYRQAVVRLLGKSLQSSLCLYNLKGLALAANSKTR